MEDTIRIDLGNGAWAVIRKEVLQRTFRLHEELLHKAMVPLGETKVKMSDMQSGHQPPKLDYELDRALVDGHAVSEIYMLNQVEEWSIGPVTKATIDNVLTRDQCLTLVKEMDRLYQPTPFASRGTCATGWARKFIALFR